MDAYRKGNSIVLWLKTPDGNQRVVKQFRSYIYIEPHLKMDAFLNSHKISHELIQKPTLFRKQKWVFKIKVPNLNGFERMVRFIEKKTRYRIPMYDADIVPEQMFLYKHNLKPFDAVEVRDKVVALKNDMSVPLKRLDVIVVASGDIYTNDDVPVKGIMVNGKRLVGDEKEILEKFVEEFIAQDPDVLVMAFAYSRLPYLVKRLEKYGLNCPFHRWDPYPIKYKGGKSFFSYGRVHYRDYSIRLHGRFLVDTTTSVGNEVDIEAIVELSQLTGTLFHKVASRSFGAAFQSSLVRQMVMHNILVHYKQKPIDRPMSVFGMLKSDRGAHTLDPKLGFHNDVAEIDFCSMFPWLIYNHNISAETILSNEGPFDYVPGIPVRVSMKHRGFVPLAIKPLIDRRMEYKMNPSALNKSKSKGLKWVLVTSYGYLRFREFKLGLASSHMAICAYARETLVKATMLAEEAGFEVIHGIVDSLYIRKKGITEEEVKKFCKELQLETGIPVSFEGIFKWVVFLASVNDQARPLPATYFGVFRNNEIKARGIEVRKRSSPVLVKQFQQQVLEILSEFESKEEIVKQVPKLRGLYYKTVDMIKDMDTSLLKCSVCVSKTSYKNNIPQKKIVEELEQRGVKVMPGQTIKFVYQQNGVVLPEDYNGKPDVKHYKELLLKSLYIVLQQFGFSKESILSTERQTKIEDYIKFVYVPIPKSYATRHGLAEKKLRQRLEKQSWTVWRGSAFNILKMLDSYPNVVRKYTLLLELIVKHHPNKLEELQYLCAVHHGMPDFVCFRNGKFKFVECKLGHEQLSMRQKKCIKKLQQLGFEVEVHKLVEPGTKLRTAMVNPMNNDKRVIEKQQRLKLKWKC